MDRRTCLALLTGLLALLGAACTRPSEVFGLPQSGASAATPMIVLSPPPEIIPVETEAGPAAPPAARSEVESSPSVSPTPEAPSSEPGGATPTVTASGSPSAASLTPSPTHTQSLPGSPTRTTTHAPAANPTRTRTPTASPTLPAPPPASPTSTSTPTGCDPQGNASFESALVALINGERQRRGLTALASQGQLAAAARIHSADMACGGFFSHTGSDGSLPWDRASAQGYSYSAIAENIFAGSSNAQAAFNAWMNSSGHRENMLNPDYTEVGIGYRSWSGSPYGSYTTAVFAHPG